MLYFFVTAGVTFGVGFMAGFLYGRMTDRGLAPHLYFPRPQYPGSHWVEHGDHENDFDDT